MSPEEVATIRTHIEREHAADLPAVVPGDEVLRLIASHEQLRHEAQQLRDRLASARTVWAERRQSHQRRLETSDGGAGVASICSDVYTKVIKELDKALEERP